MLKFNGSSKNLAGDFPVRLTLYFARWILVGTVF